MYARKVGTVGNPSRSNKSCIMSIINQMRTKLDEDTRIIVFVQKARGNQNKTSHR